MSSHSPVTALKAVESGLIDVLMFSLNPAFDLMPRDVDIMDLFEGKGNVFGDYKLEPARAALYRACEARGVGITVMKALGAGFLLSAERSPLGAPMTVAQCVNYALTRPAVAAVLVGMQAVDEVHAAAQYFELTDAERDYAPALAASPRFGADGRCMYCNHCLPCPSNIDIAAVNKYVDLVDLDRQPAASVKAHYLALGATAGECLSCGDCEARCPFGVRVRERMTLAEVIFGA
jgi:predicted aldo/keto reductase-like oxidoreductase